MGKIVLEFGFGTVKDDGKVIVPNEQKSHILNLDESAVLLVGSTQQCGGCPLWSASSGWVNHCKNSQVVTFITGSSAAGEALPKHFQFLKQAGSVLR